MAPAGTLPPPQMGEALGDTWVCAECNRQRLSKRSRALEKKRLGAPADDAGLTPAGRRLGRPPGARTVNFGINKLKQASSSSVRSSVCSLCSMLLSGWYLEL